MMEKIKTLLKKEQKKIRFVLVGGINTGLDFGTLFLLTFLGLPKISANFISTGIAFIFSFFANRSYTFKATGGDARKQIPAFILVTFIGIWVLQPIVIFLFDSTTSSISINENLRLLVAKLIATVVSLVWNYLGYSRFVFKVK